MPKLFRQFDLSTQDAIEQVDEILANPNLMPIEMTVSCSEEGYTTLLLHAHPAPEPIVRKRQRRFRRFVLYGGINEELNQVLENEDVRVLNRHDFFSSQGVIIVLDYETNPEE